MKDHLAVKRAALRCLPCCALLLLPYCGCSHALRAPILRPWNGAASPAFTIRTDGQPVDYLAVSPTGTYLAARLDATEAGVRAVTVPGTVWGLGVPHAAKEPKVVVWRIGHFYSSEVLRVETERESLHCVAFADDDRFVKIPTGHSLLTYGLAAEVPKRSVILDGMVCLAPDARLAVRLRDGEPTYDVVNIETGRTVCAIEDGAAPGARSDHLFRFSPSGRLLAHLGRSSSAGHDEADGLRLTVWDLGSCDVRFSVPVDGVRWTAPAFAPDGSVLALVGESAVELLSTRDGTIIDTLASGDGAVAFSRDGRLLAIADREVEATPSVSIAVWDLNTRSQAAHFKTEGAVRALAFSPDGTTLYSGHAGKIRAWRCAANNHKESRTILLPRISIPGDDQ